MKQLTPEHKRKMQEGRRRAKKLRPQKKKQELKEVEAQIDSLGAELDRLRSKGEPVPPSLRQDLRALSNKRLNLKWSE